MLLAFLLFVKPLMISPSALVSFITSTFGWIIPFLLMNVAMVYNLSFITCYSNMLWKIEYLKPSNVGLFLKLSLLPKHESSKILDFLFYFKNFYFKYGVADFRTTTIGNLWRNVLDLSLRNIIGGDSENIKTDFG